MIDVLIKNKIVWGLLICIIYFFIGERFGGFIKGTRYFRILQYDLITVCPYYPKGVFIAIPFKVCLLIHVAFENLVSNNSAFGHT